MSKNVGQKILETVGSARMSDAELASTLRFPLPSIRRTRLHLFAAGKLVYAGYNTDGHQTWRLRLATEQPGTYMGIQADIDKARQFSTRSDS